MISGKNIVLTGCNSGIGLEVLKLLSKNNKILCVDKNTDLLESIRNANTIILKKDVSSKEAVDEIFEVAKEIFDFIDKEQYNDIEKLNEDYKRIVLEEIEKEKKRHEWANYI